MLLMKMDIVSLNNVVKMAIALTNILLFLHNKLCDAYIDVI